MGIRHFLARWRTKLPTTSFLSLPGFYENSASTAHPLLPVVLQGGCRFVCFLGKNPPWLAVGWPKFFGLTVFLI